MTSHACQRRAAGSQQRLALVACGVGLQLVSRVHSWTTTISHHGNHIFPRKLSPSKSSPPTAPNHHQQHSRSPFCYSQFHTATAAAAAADNDAAAAAIEEDIGMYDDEMLAMAPFLPPDDDEDEPPLPIPKQTSKITLKETDMMDFDLTGGRPEEIIESEEQLVMRQQILKEIEDGTRALPKWAKEEYEGFSEFDEDEMGEWVNADDPNAIDEFTLPDWDVTFLRSKFDDEFDLSKGDPDPNIIDPTIDDRVFLAENPKDEDGIEIGWDPMRGHSNPIDVRTVVGSIDSYMIAESTRNESMLSDDFHEDDYLERNLTANIRDFRRSLQLMETYVDPFLGPDLPVPRQAAKWIGYPEQLAYPKREYGSNFFTPLENRTDFDSMSPWKARMVATEYARAKNAEWLPDGVSQAIHKAEREPYERYGTLLGSTKAGPKDEATVQAIEPVLKILGNVVDLLSIDGPEHTIFRFKYHGLIKNKYGMQCWTQQLIADHGVKVDNVIFESGRRKRDPWYDGGSHWYEDY